MRSYTTFALNLGQLQGRSQFEKRFPTVHWGNENSIRFQAAFDRTEQPRQVVHPVQTQARNDQIDRIVFELYKENAKYWTFKIQKHN